MPRQPFDTSVFAAIADPTRRAILDSLRDDELSAGELHERVGFDSSQPAFSQHLAVLRRAGLVEARSEGRQRIYRALPDPLRGVTDWATDWLDHYDRFWDESLGRLAKHLDRRHAMKPRKRIRKGGAA